MAPIQTADLVYYCTLETNKQRYHTIYNDYRWGIRNAALGCMAQILVLTHPKTNISEGIPLVFLIMG